MSINIGKEVAVMQRMTMAELRSRYAEVFGELTTVGNRAWLVKRIAWRLQSTAEGDLSMRARQRARELANDSDLRLSPPCMKAAETSAERTRTVAFEGTKRIPIPGSVITKQYKGRNLEVKVLPEGFEYEGEIYRSLSGLAKQISGTHCNGFHFFGLNKPEES